MITQPNMEREANITAKQMSANDQRKRKWHVAAERNQENLHSYIKVDEGLTRP
jgi:hypothetical protein